VQETVSAKRSKWSRVCCRRNDFQTDGLEAEHFEGDQFKGQNLPTAFGFTYTECSIHSVCWRDISLLSL